MSIKLLLSPNTLTDESFDMIYGDEVKRLSAVHWTPVSVASKAAAWLVYKEGDKILDIGSGAGKFCFVGAITTKGHFTGVEKIKKLCDISKKIQKKENLPNITFLHDDIKNISLKGYSGIYFYNAFHELILENDTIENPALIAEQMYYDYSNYLYEQLENLPVNTRLVTYYGHINQVPNNYRLVDSDFENELKFWVKEN
ncbi:MAG: methyltransferase domain-containing protein [Bacteroidetes bacterium]|nr:methyltransferase domain-containing protein [Bacteroidota bacterium]